jgi:hypothetical protein
MIRPGVMNIKTINIYQLFICSAALGDSVTYGIYEPSPTSVSCIRFVNHSLSKIVEKLHFETHPCQSLEYFKHDLLEDIVSVLGTRKIDADIMWYLDQFGCQWLYTAGLNKRRLVEFLW